MITEQKELIILKSLIQILENQQYLIGEIKEMMNRSSSGPATKHYNIISYELHTKSENLCAEIRDLL